MDYRLAFLSLILSLTSFSYSQVVVDPPSTIKHFEGTIRKIIVERPVPAEVLVLVTGAWSIRLSNVLPEYVGKNVSIEGVLQPNGSLVAKNIAVINGAVPNGELPLSGTRSVIVLVLNFLNDTSQPVPISEIRSRIFTTQKSPNKYFEQVSNGRYRLGGRVQPGGDVLGYLTLPFSNKNCTFDMYDNVYPAAANQLASQQGINVLQYHTRVYLYPAPVPACDFTYADLGIVGDTTTSYRIVMSDWNYPSFDPFGAEYIFAHEMGHNLGLQHASGYNNCPPTEPFENCQGYAEYGDRADLMGFFGYYQLNNYNRARVGWLDGQVRTLDQPGTYTFSLAGPSHPAKRPTAARIRLKDSAGEFTGSSIYLEFRRNMPPFDIFMPVLPPFPIPGPQLARDGVTIRFGEEDLSSAEARSHLIDTTPQTLDFSDAQLLVGQTFSNTYYGVSITTLGVNPGTGAQIRVVLTR
ncbi:MAG TPA: hypothetical protein VFZ49_01010 [Pyrinomonadaceae bacterium]